MPEVQPLPIPHREQPAIDRDRLRRIYADLDSHAADRVIGRAMEDLAVRLSRAERARRDGDMRRLAREARGAASVADQLGMQQVARIARDLAAVSGTPDTVAIAAVAARLDRMGELCLAAIWEAEGLSL
ncbi:MAG: hypothetical protein MUF73_07420 [Rhodobacteraceae bacterium]|jgi:hypothetical protein|nr:hypothetical protein [Paracoccaceae bacterium]